MLFLFSDRRDEQSQSLISCFVSFNDVFIGKSTKIFNRSGGYIRILKLGNRLGDNAQMAYVEFVDYNEDYIKDYNGDDTHDYTEDYNKDYNKGYDNVYNKVENKDYNLCCCND